MFASVQKGDVNATVQRAEIAERVRAVLQLGTTRDIEDAARRIGVSETALRMSVDQSNPYPTLTVLAALVKVFGMDPTYLVTGTYDAATHRQAAEDPASTRQIVRKILIDHDQRGLTRTADHEAAP